MPYPIEKNTLDFLQQLSKNNDTQWFHANKEMYQNAKLNVQNVARDVAERLATQPESGISPVYKIFRINRDIRFSKNKEPYKTNFGVVIGYNGKEDDGAAYYLHIQPGNHFVGGGIYHPTPLTLSRIRTKIASSYKELDQILNNKSFKTHYTLTGDAVKTMPKGYAKDHPAASYLKQKDFLCMCQIKEEELTHSHFSAKATRLLEVLIPFHRFLRDL